LKLSLTVLLVGAVLVLLGLRFVAPDQTLSSVGPLIMVGIALLGRHLLGRGRTMDATSVVIFGFWSTLLMVVVTTGGLRSPAVTGFPVVILTVGWLISANAAWWVTGLTVMATLVLLMLELQQMLPSMLPSPASAYASDQIIFYLVCAILTVVFRRAYRSRLRDLSRLSDALTNRTSELENRTAELKRAQSVAKIGSWTYQIASDQLVLSTEAGQIMRLEPGRLTRFEDYVRQFHPDDQGPVMLSWQAALVGAAFDQEHRIQVGDQTRWIRQIAEMAFSPDGQPVTMFGTMQDVTERKLAQLALSESEERYRVMTEWSPDSILVHRDGIILYANPAALGLFGAADAQELLGLPTSDLIQPDFADTDIENMHKLSEDEGTSTKIEARFLKLDGTPFDVEMQGTSIVFNGEPATHVSLRDITERKQMEDIIRHQALYDALTQLPNRRLLEDRLSQALAANRRSGLFSALLFLDLDNFKPLNDRYGHAVGDLLLIESARRLNHCVREADTVARFGGDEFVVLLTELSSSRQESVAFTQTVAEKIIAAITTPFVLAVQDGLGPDLDVEHHCSVSIGMLVFDGSNVPEGDLIKWADAAMYQAKAEGRSRACLYSEGQSVQDAAALALETAPSDFASATAVT
jgi:diguanylate cyclase (GGDEF)-like protein/PAS domain S-box-containing protein